MCVCVQHMCVQHVCVCVWRSALPVPGDAEVSVLHDGVEVGDADAEVLEQGRAELQEPVAAGDHLAGGDARLLGQAEEGQGLEAALHSLVLLRLQPGGRHGETRAGESFSTYTV